MQLEEQVERWSNCERVLEAMPSHDRLHHWNMAFWGEQTQCGTVACAAGHCGMDDWFRERGFKMDFVGGQPEITSVVEFFGLEGSTRIFLDPSKRPVENVIDEVRAYTNALRKMAALANKLDAPPIGGIWPGRGGVNAGPQLGRDGAPDYFLIVGPESPDLLNWRDATAWAAALDVEGHRDFLLPSRDEQLALFDRVRSLFQRDCYWSSTQHASGSSGAWGQTFYDGSQNGWFKGVKLRARAVRRLVIQ